MLQIPVGQELRVRCFSLSRMDNAQFDQSIRFAAFLIGGVLFLIFGVEFLLSGVTDWITECVSPTFAGQCSGNQIWQVLSPVIVGIVLVALAILFFVLAYRARRPSSMSVPPSPP